MTTRTLVLDGELDDCNGLALRNEDMWAGVSFRAFEEESRRFVQLSFPREMENEVRELGLNAGMVNLQRVRITVEVTD